MLLRIILIGLVLYAVYKLFGGKFLSSKSAGNDAQNMVECDACGAYVSEKDSIRFSSRHYCSIECKNTPKV